MEKFDLEELKNPDNWDKLSEFKDYWGLEEYEDFEVDEYGNIILEDE